MKRHVWAGSGWVIAAAIGLAACEGGEGTPDAVPVASFPDPALDACVREHLGVADGVLHPADVAPLLHLECQRRGIASLAGAEHLTGLTSLSLWENQIADLAPLAGLTGLVELQLGHNAIGDLAPLSGLLALERLGLSINHVSDLTPLSGLGALRTLNLDVNAISDIVPIANLPELRWVTLDHNPLGGATNEAAFMRERGVIVYEDFADAAPHATGQPGRGAARPEAPDAWGPGALAGARVSATVAADGALALAVEIAGRRHPVIAEFGDRLRARLGVVYDRAGGVDVAVGTVSEAGEVELCRGAYTHVCAFALGAKGSAGERSPLARSDAPVITASLRLANPRRLLRDGDAIPYGSSDRTLEPYVLASPNQLDAGSCIFMATTGAMELLVNQGRAFEEIVYGGDTDFSERYLMNAYDYVGDDQVRWFFTDLLYVFNVLGGALLDRDYPFIAGCLNEAEDPVACTSPEAKWVSLQVNWQDDLPEGWQDTLTATPLAERTSIFVDPRRDDNSQWRVALVDDLTIEKIKYELRTKKAPVLIVYNHFLYWHADLIVGYDDLAENVGCPMVTQSMSYFRQQDADSYANAIQAAIDEDGGCVDQGVFYVRDSIYDGGADEPTYEYGGDADYTEKYSKRIIERDYEWVRYLANHAYTIHRSR